MVEEQLLRLRHHVCEYHIGVTTLEDCRHRSNFFLDRVLESKPNFGPKPPEMPYTVLLGSDQVYEYIVQYFQKSKKK